MFLPLFDCLSSALKIAFWMLSYFRLEELQVLDIKFLYGCPRPTIVVLYQVSILLYILYCSSIVLEIY